MNSAKPRVLISWMEKYHINSTSVPFSVEVIAITAITVAVIG